jgi:uncharacterized delta-60 repeat protein
VRKDKQVKKRIPAALTGTLVLGLAMGLASASTAAAGTAGSLDPTFGKGGIVLTNLGLNAGGSQIQAVPSDAALLPNGDIVVAGNFGLVRYRPNGSLDSTFGTGGLAQLPPNGIASFPPSLAIQPDGKYVWAGEATAPNGTNGAFAAVRFNANGTVDQTFGTGGLATTAFPNSNVQGADAVLVQPDGKILLGGEALQNSYHAPAFAALARFNANGTPDQAFGSGGQVQSSSIGNITTLGLDAAGDIFVLPAHAEFSPTGQLDSSVTPAAITISSHGGNAAFLPSGQYVLGNSVSVARHDVDIQVQRFNADGSLAAASTAFDFSGATGLDQASDSAGAVAIQPNGQIVVAGAHFLGTSPIGAARVNVNGSLDATFGSGGTLTTTIQGDEGASALLIQTAGKIIAVGFSENNSTGIADVALVRYLGQ